MGYGKVVMFLNYQVIRRILNHFIFYLFLITFVFAFGENAVSQMYSITHYSVEEGLSSRNILDITQDNTGRIWVATNAGISMYDGYEWTNYDLKDISATSKFVKIKRDEKGYIWAIPVLVDNNILVYKNGNWEVFGKLGSANMVIGDVSSFDIAYENDKPVLCIGTIKGLLYYKNEIWTAFYENKGLLSNQINHLVYNKGKFYISTPKGLTVFIDGIIDNSLNKVISKEFASVINVLFDNGKMWLLGYNKLGVLENNVLKIISKDFQIPEFKSLEFSHLSKYKEDFLFFGNLWSRFYLNLRTGNVLPLQKINGFLSNSGTSVFVDKEDNIWFTGKRGIDKINSLAFRNHSIYNGLPEEEVSAINEFSPGVYIIGHNNGITIFKNYKYNYIPFKNFENYSIHTSRVLDIYKDKNGNMWIAASMSGVGKVSEDGNINWVESPPGFSATSIMSDELGNIFVGGSKGLFVISNNKLEKQGDVSKVGYYIRKMFRLSDGSLWVAGDDGVYIQKGNLVKHITVKNNSTANNVYSVFEDNKKRILIGTLEGLYTIQNDSMFKFDDNGFKINDAVFTMIQDKENNYWFGTGKNLIKWNGINFEKEFNSKNGLVAGEISRSALFEDYEGKIWIGTDAGISRYTPELDYKSNNIPRVEILSIEDPVGNRYDAGKDIYLEINRNYIHINFRGISFVDESAIQYKIKLEGYDDDWVTINREQIGKVYYKDLKPGDYKFKLKAKNPSGEWSGEVSSSIITIMRPFYLQWWFILMVMLATIGILYLLNRFYMNKLYLGKLEDKIEKRTAELIKSKKELKKSYDTLEEKVTERTSELEQKQMELKEIAKELKATNASKDKFFSILAHDLRNPFTSIFGFSEVLIEDYKTLSRDEIKNFAENIKNASKSTYGLLENLLQWGRMQTGRIEFIPAKIDISRVDTIVNLLKPLADNKEIGIMNNVIGSNFVIGDKYMLQTVLQNLISNAIKFTQRKGKIEIYSAQNRDRIFVSVKDNGIGISEEDLKDLFKIDKLSSRYGTEKETGTGLGLIICKDMIEKQDGDISVESIQGKGSTFTISLPVWKEL